MEHQQQQQQPIHSGDHGDPNLMANAYSFYAGAVEHHDPSTYNMHQPFQQQLGSPYQLQHPGMASRHLSAPDLHNAVHFNDMSLMSQQYTQQPVYGSPAQHVSMGLPPASPHMYDPLSPPTSDTSEGIYHHSRNSSASGSPSSSRSSSLVHRNSLRYNPIPSPSNSSVSSGRRGRGRSLRDSDEEEMGALYLDNLADNRKEATRRQRIEAEQKRRDELRDGYQKLKEVLPVSTQKSSKCHLLERATTHIVALEKRNQEMLERLEKVEQEVKRLRDINERLTRGLGHAASPGQSMMSDVDPRPLSPPPETTLPGHSLTMVQGQQIPRERSRSPASSDEI